NDYHLYDFGDSIIAYSFSVTACNPGDEAVTWQAGSPNHPVRGQAMYRVKDGRFEQLGQSWVNHGFCALGQAFCNTSCQAIGCGNLGVGCSSPNTASSTASIAFGPKSDVNAATGVFPYPPSMTVDGSVNGGRLQVRRDDVDPALNPGALYFAEFHYVAQDDAAAGNNNNNASYRRIDIESDLEVSFPEATSMTRPAILAWGAHDASVKIDSYDIPGDGRIWVGYKSSDNGDGTWHYEYAVQNLNSDRSVGAFTIALTATPNLTNVGFHDVDYHSGEPYSGDDWDATLAPAEITWQTQTFLDNPNANALRWGTLYNFRFDADTGPTLGTATLDLFKPGTPDAIDATVFVPQPPEPIPATPSGVTAENTDSCDTIDVAWSSAAGADDYEIYRNNTNDSAAAVLINTIPGLVFQDLFPGENGSNWHYWVKACNANGCSALSASASATLTTRGDFDQNDLFNGADIIGFVAAATAGDTCADLAAPFGTIDHTDTSAFTDLLLGL
ncbi:MAG: hypothetical protein O7D94_10165, partial [Planctomycetota bacterium]|nr:hypothetical protein [Planctomycetota bacterium]